MYIWSHNVNGLRSRLKNDNYEDVIKELRPDILCIQEQRATEAQLPKGVFEEYEYRVHSLSQYKGGYAGSSIYSLRKPLGFLQDEDIMNIEDLMADTGRISGLEFEDFILLSIYTPNAGGKLERLAQRINWQNKLLDWVKRQEKALIICGDLNVAPEKIDVGYKYIKSGVSPEERAAHQELLDTGLVDVWRFRHPNYTQFTQFTKTWAAKANDAGIRIDHFLTTDWLAGFVSNVEICDEYAYGSDHVPLLAEVDDLGIRQMIESAGQFSIVYDVEAKTQESLLIDAEK